MRYRNICANQLPKQIAKHYDENTLERIAEVTVTNEPAADNVIRPTMIVVHPNNTADTFQWTPNPDPAFVDRFPNVWVQVEQGAALVTAAA